jgi:hypothetical protein
VLINEKSTLIPASLERRVGVPMTSSMLSVDLTVILLVMLVLEVDLCGRSSKLSWYEINSTPACTSYLVTPDLSADSSSG